MSEPNASPSSDEILAAMIAGGIAMSHHNDEPAQIARKAIAIAQAIRQQLNPASAEHPEADQLVTSVRIPEETAPAGAGA